MLASSCNYIIFHNKIWHKFKAIWFTWDYCFIELKMFLGRKQNHYISAWKHKAGLDKEQDSIFYTISVSVYKTLLLKSRELKKWIFVLKLFVITIIFTILF